MRRLLHTLLALVPLLLGPSVSAQSPDEIALLWRQASVYRDEWGTPHVFADNFRALAFAFGYAQAEDHIEPMMLAYRIANGRAAEVLGPSMAVSDEFALKLGHARHASAAYRELDPLTRELCEGFAIGVNAWLVSHPGKVPPWCDGVRPEDILALTHCLMMSQAPFDLPGAFRRDPFQPSANAWAVAPSKSETGQALLVINPHAPFDGPFRWYEAQLTCQDLNVAGATLYGLPVIVQGHNESLGWALAPNRPDTADVYLETPPRPTRPPGSVGRSTMANEMLLEMYLMAQAQQYYVASANGPESRTAACVDTARGPVVGMNGGKVCLFQAGGYRDFGTIAQWMAMGRARDLGTFQQALSMHQMPCFHVVYADREGNIFYLYNAKTGDKASAARMTPTEVERAKAEAEARGDDPDTAPTRRPINWSAPLPAEDPTFAWGPVIPVQTLPALTNPKSGYIQACGTPPWAVTEESGMAPDAFPPWFVHDPDTLRAQRVRKLLSLGKRSFEDCQAMLYDVVVPLASEATPRLIAAATQHADRLAALHPDLPMCLELLKKWNSAADLRSTGMTFFHAWWTALHGTDPQAFRDEQALYSALFENAPAFQEISLNAAAEAARTLRNHFSGVTVPWGQVHTVRRGDREVPLPGAATGEPLFVASDTVFDAGKWRATYGYGFAMVVAFGPTPQAVAMSPFGASEDPASPHYADQLELMAGRRFRIARFLPEDVQRNAESAKGCHLRLLAQGTEATFLLDSPYAVDARLTVFAEPSVPLPADTTPFTLFLHLEKAPKTVPMNTRMEIQVPAVLCAREYLPQLAVYSCAPNGQWEKVPDQRLDRDARVFQAQIPAGEGETPAARTYAVLGPPSLRAERLAVPGEETAPPPTAPPTPDPAAAKPADRPSRGFKMTIRRSADDPSPVVIDLDTLKKTESIPSPDNAANLLTPGSSETVQQPDKVQTDVAPSQLPLVSDLDRGNDQTAGASRNFNRNLPGRSESKPEKKAAAEPSSEAKPEAQPAPVQETP